MLLTGHGDASALSDDFGTVAGGVQEASFSHLLPADTRHFLSTDFDAKEDARLLFERLRRAETYAPQEGEGIFFFFLFVFLFSLAGCRGCARACKRGGLHV